MDDIEKFEEVIECNVGIDIFYENLIKYKFHNTLIQTKEIKRILELEEYMKQNKKGFEEKYKGIYQYYEKNSVYFEKNLKEKIKTEKNQYITLRLIVLGYIQQLFNYFKTFMGMYNYKTFQCEIKNYYKKSGLKYIIKDNNWSLNTFHVFSSNLFNNVTDPVLFSQLLLKRFFKKKFIKKKKR
jgi:hypothetical protein